MGYEEVVLKAAEICAYYSDGRGASKVPVDYCRRKSASIWGMHSVSTNKTSPAAEAAAPTQKKVVESLCGCSPFKLLGSVSQDIWLHTQNYHSSHVVIVTEGKTAPEEVVLKAAEICAYYSDGRGASKVAAAPTQKKVVESLCGCSPFKLLGSVFFLFTPITKLCLPNRTGTASF